MKGDDRGEKERDGGGGGEKIEIVSVNTRTLLTFQFHR